MTCAACGSENFAPARFCASCGAPLASGHPAGLVPRPQPQPAFVAAPRPMVAEMLYVCPHCGRTMRPLPYFSRGVNVAKALVLMIPLSFIGPVLFFFLRKDRLVCGACRRMLSGEAAVSMIDAFSPERQFLPAMGGAGGVVAVYDPEEDLAVLERKSRRYRTRAWTWGVIGGGLVALGAATTTGDLTSMAGFLGLGTVSAMGAAWAVFRSRTFGRLAAAKRARQQRGRVLQMARAAGGRLNVSVVAAELHIELDDAERLLGGMVDGQRVEMDVDDAGRISYVFTELRG